jgi:hypothetical protein
VKLFGTGADGAHDRVVAFSDAPPAGAMFWVQALVLDAGGPEGWAFTNGVKVTGQ